MGIEYYKIIGKLIYLVSRILLKIKGRRYSEALYNRLYEDTFFDISAPPLGSISTRLNVV